MNHQEMGVSDERATHRRLTEEATEFLYYEAELLDERRFEEWLDLLTDDITYSMPLRLNVSYSEQKTSEYTQPGRDVCWIDEGKDTLTKRVQQIRTEVHWAEEPLSRTSHLVTNVRVRDLLGQEMSVGSRFLLYRNRVADETDILVGGRVDTLRQIDGTWRLCKRNIYLDQNVLLAKNLTMFF